MSLIKWNRPLSMSPTFTNMIENFFGDEDFLSNFWKNRMELPAVNIREDEKFFTMELAVPGMKKDDFKVEVENGVLTVSAETKMEKKEEDKDYTRREFSFQTFQRSFRLPDNINAETIKANYKDGILALTLPKLKVEKVTKAKKIEIG